MAPVASDRPVQVIIRIAGGVCILTAFLVFTNVNPHFGASHQPGCPSYAFGNPWLLKGERALLTLALLTIVLTYVVRVTILGSVPDQIGQTGAGWSGVPEALGKVTETTEQLEMAMKTVEQDVKNAQKATSTTAADSAKLIQDLENRVATLEGRTP